MNEKGTIEQIPERQVQCLRLRQSGRSYREIGDIVGVCPKTAWNDVKSALEYLRKECTEEAKIVRDLQVQRIDKAMKAIWDQVIAGSVIHINTFIKLEDQRARLIGTNAPTKQEIDVTTPEPIQFVLNEEGNEEG